METKGNNMALWLQFYEVMTVPWPRDVIFFLVHFTPSPSFITHSHSAVLHHFVSCFARGSLSTGHVLLTRPVRYFNNMAAGGGATASAAEPKLDKMFDELRSEWMASLVLVLHRYADN